ncbi:hypothetical protein ANO11243_016740 [Dothideomycetidae sp. 11243]|nr:hypothetical protein ANO11243_016740 [fungal sp. No.11243]
MVVLPPKRGSSLQCGESRPAEQFQPIIRFGKWSTCTSVITARELNNAEGQEGLAGSYGLACRPLAEGGRREQAGTSDRTWVTNSNLATAAARLVTTFAPQSAVGEAKASTPNA